MEENKPCIAIYDVRGIQNYIFRTNAVKEIMGASKIVDKLIINEFAYATKKIKNEQKINENEIILDWDKQNDFSFGTNSEIKIEVLYYGGGNLVVLFRNEELCKSVSIEMSKNIIKNAYGLSLVYAYTEKTEDYNSDWTNLKKRLSEIKAVTTLNKPAGILPIIKYDGITGKPLSQKYDGRMVTYEAYQKLKKSEEISREKSEYIKEFDKMRTSEEEGLIAIVHIDGNSMGANIREIMKDTATYKEAVRKMREISKNIHEVFEVKAINSVKEKIAYICKKHSIEIKSNKLPFRPVIQAGDDITFVCNERIALDIVKEYINSIKKGFMYEQKYPFSACAGIAIIHSHFPFYKGYQVAEQCCEQAKKRAKNEGMINGKIGNFVDFEYCYSVNTVDIEESRKKNYCNIEGISLLKRPYGIYDENENLNELQKTFDIKVFEEDLKMLKGISRGTAKAFRDAYYKETASINTLFERQKIKNGISYKDAFKEVNGKKYAEYFDSLEMLDIFGIREEEE